MQTDIQARVVKVEYWAVELLGPLPVRTEWEEWPQRFATKADAEAKRQKLIDHNIVDE